VGGNAKDCLRKEFFFICSNIAFTSERRSFLSCGPCSSLRLLSWRTAITSRLRSLPSAKNASIVLDEVVGACGREIKRLADHREIFTFSLRLGSIGKFEPFGGNLQPYRFVLRIGHFLSDVGGFFGSLTATGGVVQV
jgi:hypothetical protein